ncbi:unnamed protein product [Allacma fusca]|uniref:Uncharacterized protein n=1 Tax=Allacma fusca TaxID=39272 RepID=A0A8J2PGC4_9HEXA|nr:unnamed protein product [Allacma fusca]
MMLAANITVIFMFMEISTNLVVSQFSNGYRNWFKFAPRNVPLYPLCLPDGSPSPMVSGNRRELSGLRQDV